MNKLIRTVLLPFTLVALAAPVAMANGPAVFRAQNCTGCHSISVAGIARNATHDEEAIDLSKVGTRHDKKWIALFMLKRVEREGEKHKKQFQGSTEDLKTVAEWLETLK